MNLIYLQHFLSNLSQKYGNSKKGGQVFRAENDSPANGAFESCRQGTMARGVHFGCRGSQVESLGLGDLMGVADAYEQLHNDECLLFVLRWALDASPKDITANRRAAQTLGRLGQFDQAITGDGQLHVIGLQSGKDLQKPAPFLPVNSRWSNPIAVGTVMYAATSGNCAGAPNAVYAIDLDAADKPVVSYHTSGGNIVGSVAFSSDGKTLLAAIGPGTVKGDGKANAIVALDPITLRLKDWFTQPTAEFVTGPTVFRHGTRDIVAASTKDGRVILLDTASLGGTKHDTPLVISPALFESGGSIAAEALATWARPIAATATGARTEARSLLVPIQADRQAVARPTGQSEAAQSSHFASRRATASYRWNRTGRPMI